MAKKSATRTEATRPKIRSTDAVRLLQRRCLDFEARLDQEKGRKSAIGRNPNVLAMTYLDKLLDAFTEIEADCRLSRVHVHEHDPDGIVAFLAARERLAKEKNAA